MLEKEYVVALSPPRPFSSSKAASFADSSFESIGLEGIALAEAFFSILVEPKKPLLSVLVCAFIANGTNRATSSMISNDFLFILF